MYPGIQSEKVMARRRKHNPLYYNLKGLRNERFEHRSLKRYKKKFPRERLISKWFPWADIHIIGIDLYEGETDKDGLIPRMNEHYEVKVLLRMQWKFGKAKYPQTADLDSVELKWAAAFFSKFLTWQTQALHGFICSKERYEEIKEYLRQQHIWKFRKDFDSEVEALIFSPFDQVYNDFAKIKGGDIMVGLAPTGGLEAQLTPQMMLHELTEYILSEAETKGLFDRYQCLLDYGRILPKFEQEHLYGSMMRSYIGRQETAHLLLELYWRNGRLFTPDDFITHAEAFPNFEDLQQDIKEQIAMEKAGIKDILEIMRIESRIYAKNNILERWMRRDFSSATESEKIQRVGRINEFVLEYTEQFLEIDKPIFMRL